MLRATALSLTCAALALFAASCGESASGGDADPASLVPAGTALYAEVAVQPTGERRDDALAAAGKILGTGDPAGELSRLIDEALAKEPGGLTWEKDFAPWLGEEVGVYAANLEAEEPSFAAIVATTDAEAARAAIQKFKETGEGTYEKRSHGDVDYELNEDGTAAGMVDDFLVLATEDLFKRTVDMRDGGDSLADADRYKEAVEDTSDSLAHYFVDTKTLIDLALKQDPTAAAQFEQFRSFLPVDKLGPVTGAFDADGESLAFDTVLTGVPEGAFRQLASLWAGGETELLGDLPGDAWGAYAFPKLGEGAESLFNTFAGALGGAAIAGQFKQETGLDLKQDIFSWVGDAGLFVRGTTMAELDGAFVIQSTDDARAEAAFGKLIGLIGKEAGAAPAPLQLEGAAQAFKIAAPGAEQPIVLARGEGRVVAAYGEAAATAAIQPDTELAGSDLYSGAEEVLGDGLQPAFVLSVGDAIALADAVGATDPEFDEARPYLERLGTVVSGGQAEDDTIRSRVGVSLK